MDESASEAKKMNILDDTKIMMTMMNNENNNGNDDIDDNDENVVLHDPPDPFEIGYVKPALKKKKSHTTMAIDHDHDHNDNNDYNHNNNSTGGRILKWDEAKIEEHDKLRGTRMKIEEPNTPFHHHHGHDHQHGASSSLSYDSGSETDGSYHGRHKDQEALSWDHLENKLHGVAAAQNAYPSSPASSHGGSASNGQSMEAMDTTDSQGMENPPIKVGEAPLQDDARNLTVDEEREKDMKAIQFKEHRKRHYNEMELVRRFREQHPDGDDDEDEEEDEE